MTSKSNKITLRETFAIHYRAYRDLRPYCPDAFAAAGLHGVVSALSPYATVYLSARLINELAGARRPEVLWPLVAITLAVTAGLVLLTGALLHWKNAAADRYNQAKEKLFTDKMLSLDYADVDNAKPDPEPVNRILRQLDRDADTAMVVGDTAFDITMGRRAGAHTCGVTYGNGTLRELEQSGAECVIDDFSALPDVISRTAAKQVSDAQ